MTERFVTRGFVGRSGQQGSGQADAASRTPPGSVRALRAVHMMAEMRSCVPAPGTVLRCPICDGVILRIVETDEATYVDARGMACLRFEPR